MNIDFIWFTIIVFLPIAVLFGVNLFIDHFYSWWVERQETKYIRKAHKTYKENK